MRERGAVRVIPRRAVAVAIEGRAVPVAHGLVANISETGVCIRTDAAFEVGDTLVLRLSFAQQPQLLQAAGHVVWSERTPDRGGERHYGLQWAHNSGPEHARLKGVISTSL